MKDFIECKYEKLDEGDVRDLIVSSYLKDDSVLANVCKAMNVSIKVDRGLDRWVVSPPATPDYAGSRSDIVAWVNGYASSWLVGKLQLRQALGEVKRLADSLGDPGAR